MLIMGDIYLFPYVFAYVHVTLHVCWKMHFVKGTPKVNKLCDLHEI